MAPSDKDEIRLATQRLARLVSAARMELIIGVVAGLVIAFLLFWASAPTYTATARIVASSAVVQSDSSSTMSTLSTLANAAAPSKDLSSFDRLQIVLSSVGLGQRILADERAREILFPDRWDSSRAIWVKPSGLLPWIKRQLKAVLKQPDLPVPDAQVAIDALSRRLSISTDNNVVRISFTGRDPAAAAYMLRFVLNQADNIVRHDYLEVAERYSDYIGTHLPATTNIDIQSSLAQLLNGYQRTVVMARVNLPFSYSAIDPIFSPDRPSGPSIAVFLLIGAIVGALLGALWFAFTRSLLRRTATRFVGSHSQQPNVRVS